MSLTVSTSSAFGPLVSGADVEDHIGEILTRWYPSYIYETERLHGVTPGTLPLPRSTVRSSETEKFAEDQLPALIIASPGINEPPETDGGGIYSATWQLELAAQVAAAPNRRALQLARWYTAALRACVVQQQQDPGLASPLRLVRLDWRAERYGILDSIDDRTVCVGAVDVNVTVAEVLSVPGPLEPTIPPQPPLPTSPEWPTVSDVLVDVDRDPLT